MTPRFEVGEIVDSLGFTVTVEAVLVRRAREREQLPPGFDYVVRYDDGRRLRVDENSLSPRGPDETP